MSNQQPIDSPKAPCPNQDRQDQDILQQPSVTACYHVFFDGTANNRFNVTERVEGNPSAEEFGDEKSYTAYYTNVAYLETLALKSSQFYNFVDKIYVEGVGTEDAQGDSVMLGYGLGEGDTGIKAKAKNAQAMLKNWLLQLDVDMRDGYKVIDQLTINVFGFSRGAATARHFISLLLKDKEYGLNHIMAETLVSIKALKFGFAGLFDTVSSFGLHHGTDVKQLSLDAVQYADRTYQIAAAEEHRKNFALTNIKSAGGKGTEVFIPGVHADIGGGYNPVESESDKILFEGTDEEVAQQYGWLIKLGWYTAKQLTIKPSGWFSDAKLIGERHQISNQYAKIPLNMMLKEAMDNKIEFDPLLRIAHAVPEELASVDQEIAKRNSGQSTTSIADWFDCVESWLIALRHKYLHFSADANGFIGVNLYNIQRDNGRVIRERKIFSG